jgi:hypothetical protein
MRTLAKYVYKLFVWYKMANEQEKLPGILSIINQQLLGGIKERMRYGTNNNFQLEVLDHIPHPKEHREILKELLLPKGKKQKDVLRWFINIF